MDLKIKSISWVGRNISQKFETMCQQVDNIMSQDTVKYVENQMQTVGGSVKRFCSDVVQDLLPPLVDPEKHDAQEVVLERNDATGAYSKPDTEKKLVDTVIEQLREEPNPVDHMKGQHGHAVTGLYHENQLITPVSVDPVDGLGYDLVSGETIDVLTHESSDEDFEENAVKDKSSESEVLELMSLSKMDLSETSMLRESSGSNNRNGRLVVVEISDSNSVDVVHGQPTQIVDTVCDNFADDSVSVFASSITFAASEMALSVPPCEKRLISSCDPRFMESNNLHEDSLDYLTAENTLCTDAVDGVGCVYDSCEAIPSSTYSPIVSHMDKGAEMELINSNSGEEDVSRTNYATSVSEKSRKTNCEFCGSAQSEAIAIPLVNGTSYGIGKDLDYSGMETIELCDNVKLEDSCVMADNSALYALSYKTRKLRSFKVWNCAKVMARSESRNSSLLSLSGRLKRIQDAFTSKRRLVKEYEQLAIWFGDVYIGPEEDLSQIHLPATPSATLESENSNTSHTGESEWELL